MDSTTSASVENQYYKIKMKVIVTGGAGFIGSHVSDVLLDRGDTVICIDDFNDYYNPDRKRENIKNALQNPNFILEEGDIRDYKFLEQVFQKHNPEKIIHLAARAGVRASTKDPFIYIQTNIDGTHNLLDLSVKHKIKNFVYASSSSVYGKNKKIPFSENDNVDNPVSVYAATKKACELLTYTYHHMYGLKCTGLRFFTVYGPRGRPDMVPYMFTNKIYRGEEITVFGTGDDMKRDYTYITDIVRGVIAALDKDLDYEIINLGNSTPITLNRFIPIVEQNLGKKAIIKNMPIPPTEVPITYANTEKAERLLGFKINTPPEEGIKRLVQWFLETKQK